MEIRVFLKDNQQHGSGVLLCRGSFIMPLDAGNRYFDTRDPRLVGGVTVLERILVEKLERANVELLKLVGVHEGEVTELKMMIASLVSWLPCPHRLSMLLHLFYYFNNMPPVR